MKNMVEASMDLVKLQLERAFEITALKYPEIKGNKEWKTRVLEQKKRKNI